MKINKQEYYCVFDHYDLENVSGGFVQIDTDKCNSVTIINQSTNAFIFVNNNPIRPGGAYINNLVFRGNEKEIFLGKIIIRKGKTIPIITSFEVDVIRKLIIK